MKIQGWLITVGAMVLTFIGGCAEKHDSPDPTTHPKHPTPIEHLPSTPPSDVPLLMEVIGSAEFGNQCPYGSFVPPSPVALELWNCPLNLPKLELSRPLPSLILQADCKKKTIDIRSEDRAIPPVTWEMMPDGNFYLAFNAGSANIKNDGAGNNGCTVPLVAYLWGRVECQNRDKATLKVEAIWKLGEVLEEPAPTPSASPRATPSSEVPQPSGTPSSSPETSPRPSGGPTPEPSNSNPWTSPSGNPSASPSTNPSTSPSIVPTPINSGTSRGRPPIFNPRPHSPHNNLSNETGSPSCRIPKGCYFHTIVKIEQCS